MREVGAGVLCLKMCVKDHDVKVWELKCEQLGFGLVKGVRYEEWEGCSFVRVRVKEECDQTVYESVE